MQRGRLFRATFHLIISLLPLVMLTKSLFSALFAIALTLTASAQGRRVNPALLIHNDWSALLNKHVHNGAVDYAAMRKDSKALDAYLAKLSANVPSASASQNEAMAFWINAYNAYTVKLIVDNPKVKSIQDLDKGKPWDRVWITLGSKKYSLSQIENDILRKMGDPRIHFAINCASRSCPTLLNEAYSFSTLDAQLDAQTRAFINSPSNNIITQSKTGRGGTNVQVSHIFEWYAKDFGDVPAFINKYAKAPIPANAKISYLTYDWSLNGK